MSIVGWSRPVLSILTSTEYPPSVDFEQETGPWSVYQGFLDELDSPEPDSVFSRADGGAILSKSRGDQLKDASTRSKKPRTLCFNSATTSYKGCSPCPTGHHNSTSCPTAKSHSTCALPLASTLASSDFNTFPALSRSSKLTLAPSTD